MFVCFSHSIKTCFSHPERLLRLQGGFVVFGHFLQLSCCSVVAQGIRQNKQAMEVTSLLKKIIYPGQVAWDTNV